MKKTIKNKTILICIFMVLLAVLSAWIATIIPKIYQVVVDNGIANGDRRSLLICLGQILLLTCINSLIKLFNNININKMGIMLTKEIKERVIHKIFNAPLNFFDRISKGELMERVKEVDALSSIFTPQILSIVVTMITAVIAIVRMCLLDWRYLIVYVIALPLLSLVSFKLSVSYKEKMRELITLNTQTSKLMYEGFSGISELKSFNMVLKRQDEINKLNTEIYQKTKQQNAIFSLNAEIINLINICVSVVITLMFANFFDKKGCSIGQYVQITNYSSLILAPAQMSATVLTMIQPIILIIKRLKFFDYYEEQDVKKGQAIREVKSICFSDVSFGYEKEKYVLEHLNFNIESSGITMISGRNGSGKTTVVKLLLRLYDSFQGKILLNNTDILNYTIESIRSEITVVFQEVFLFDASIGDNIQCGDKLIDRKIIKDVFLQLGVAGIFGGITDEEILDIPVTEGGKNLSGGQRRIISIVRALVRNPSVIILDEPIANLDPETSSSVIHSITNIKDKIVIVISHDKKFERFSQNLIELTCDREKNKRCLGLI